MRCSYYASTWVIRGTHGIIEVHTEGVWACDAREPRADILNSIQRCWVFCRCSQPYQNLFYGLNDL